MTTNLFPLLIGHPPSSGCPHLFGRWAKPTPSRSADAGPSPKSRFAADDVDGPKLFPELGPRIKLGHEKTALALAGRSLAAIDLGLADFAGLDQRVHADLGQIVPVPVHA